MFSAGRNKTSLTLHGSQCIMYENDARQECKLPLISMGRDRSIGWLTKPSPQNTMRMERRRSQIAYVLIIRITASDELEVRVVQKYDSTLGNQDAEKY